MRIPAASIPSANGPSDGANSSQHSPKLARRKPRRPALSAAPREVHRLDALVSRRAAPKISAALFSGLHTPNGLPMAVTLPTGYVCARIYRRYPNLYFLGAAHATVGFLLFLVVPDSISHHLSVGLGRFSR
jgi:hypothetical protein